MKKRIEAVYRITEIPVYLFFILIYPFLYLRFGLDYTDGPYHYMAFTGLRPADNMTFLYSVLGMAWVHLTGDSVISCRILARLIELLYAVIPALLILGLHGSLKEKLRYVAVAMIFLTALSSNLAGYDLFSNFTLSLIFVAGYYYIRSGSRVILIFLGILTAVISAIRLPSAIVIFPILFIVLSVNISKKVGILKLAGEPFILLFVGVICYFFLWWMFFGSKQSNVGEHSANVQLSYPALNQLLNAPGSGYSLKKLFVNYVLDGLRIVEMVALLTLLSVIWIRRKSITARVWIIYAGMIVFLSCYFMYYVLQSYYNNSLSFFFSSFVLFMLGLLFYDAVIKKDFRMILFLLFTAMIGFVPALGSNTGLLKLSRGYILALPVLTFYIIKLLNHDNRKGFYMLIFVVVFFSVYHKVIIGKTYEDGKNWQLNAEVNQPKLYGIKTSVPRKLQIQEILGIVHSIKMQNNQSTFFFYGSKSYLFSYLTNTPQPYNHEFWMDYNDARQAESFGNFITAAPIKPYVFLIFDYPERNSGMNGGLIEEQLKMKSFRQIGEGSNYRIFSCCL